MEVAPRPAYRSDAWKPVFGLCIGMACLLMSCSQADRRVVEQKDSNSIKLVRADAKALNELVAAHRGKVVLVDYWATWCLPCVENFPHTVELAKQHKDRGLATIAVSFDLFEDETKVRDFLAKLGADFDNLISSHNSVGQQAWQDFDIGPLPEYRLYDRKGKLKHKWESGVNKDELDQKIAELLAEES